MTAPLDEKKRLAMFDAWCVKQNTQYVADTVVLSRKTITKYRKLDKWDERRLAVKKKVEKKSDNEIAKRTARQLNQAKLLQKVGTDYYIDGHTGKVKPNAIKKARDATSAIKDGVLLERQILGDDQPVTPNVTINVVYVNVDPNVPPPVVRRVESEEVEK